MKTLNTVLFSMIFFSFITCGSTKKVANENSSENHVMNNETSKAMTNEGYLEGVIIANKDKNSTCDFYIKEIKTDKLLDPINLDKDFKVADKKVWFTYGPLRMRNRCGNIQPVSIDDIKKREE